MPQYKKGVFLNIFGHEPAKWRKDASFAKSLKNLDHAEILLEYLPTQDECRELGEILGGLKRIVHAPFTSLTLCACWPEIIEGSLKVFKMSLAAADRIGAEVATIHANERPFHMAEAVAREACIKNFGALLRAGFRVKPALENLPAGGIVEPNYPQTVAQMEELLQALPGVRFTLDVGHAIQNKDDFYSFFKKHHAAILDIHLHDAIWGGRGHLALGKGDLDLEKFLAALREIDYGGFVSLETIGEEDTALSWEILHKAEKKF